MGLENFPVHRSELPRDGYVKLLRDGDFTHMISSIRCLPVARPTRIVLVGETI